MVNMEASSFDAYLMTNDTSIGDVLHCNSRGDETLCAVSSQAQANDLPMCSGHPPTAFVNTTGISAVLLVIASYAFIKGAPQSTLKSITRGKSLLARLFPLQRKVSPRPPQLSLSYQADRATGSVSAKKNQACESKVDSAGHPAAAAATGPEEEIIESTLRGKIPGHRLESVLDDTTKAVKVRRAVVARNPKTKDVSKELEASDLPYEHYDFAKVAGVCCENVIGYMPIPVGVAGPITVNGHSFFLPMATTEGALVASTSRGCKALNASAEGVSSFILEDGMSRGPCVRFADLTRAVIAKLWIDSEQGQSILKAEFDSTSSVARLQKIKTTLAGSDVYIRFTASTGDAMGMNMISKGVEAALSSMRKNGFEDMEIMSVSGNYCTDKKSAAVNWIEGRGKTVVAQATISAEVVKKTLKVDTASLVDLNESKNLVGSAIAGSIGGFNAHAANIVTAIFLATGQDVAQNVESSCCITIIRR